MEAGDPCGSFLTLAQLACGPCDLPKKGVIVKDSGP